MPDGSYSSQIRRVYHSENNLYKLELFNEISRKICREPLPLYEFDEMIKEAKAKKAYPKWVKPLFAVFVTGGFTIFFGGTLRDGIASGLVGAIVCLVDMLCDKKMNNMAKLVINSIVGGLLSCLAVKIGLGQNESTIMIGTIMLHVPGLSFGTALRDLLGGDLLAGSLRTVQAILSAVMIAFGYMLAMTIAGGGL